MADQNFMDLASKTASGITGTDYMMLVNNSEAYKALVNDVAEAILGKLTSKSFSGLETTAKNLISAVNELNSNRLYGSSGSISVDVKSRSGILIIGHPTIKERNAMYFFCCSADAGNLVTIIEPRDMIQVALEVTTLKITASSGTFQYRIYF